MQQYKHDTIPLQKHNQQICVVCNFIQSPANLGLISRNAEAFGVQDVFMSSTNIHLLNSNRFLKTARNTDRNIHYKLADSLKEELLIWKEVGFTILALEWTKTSKPLQEMKSMNKVLILLGNENNGIPEEFLLLSDEIVHINQFGNNSSINVAQALGICLYELTR